MAEYIDRNDIKYELWGVGPLSEPLMVVRKTTVDKIPAADVAPAQRWIPVTERLPDNGTIVLVYRPKMAIKYLVTEYCNDFLSGDFDIYANRVITHWIPLPELPKEVDHD